ncbi:MULTISPECIES: hypothetical protein [Mesobacillus]|uniref:Transposase n=1 Tax=Mesobacillus stamsii TaxID=225347 RepID=A0ABU0G1B6_9BACI|nr:MULTISPECIES: hypothetical protein [Mesobacillus]MDQ0415403.1 hypothetical protein [Mesobacillus stamsii]
MKKNTTFHNLFQKIVSEDEIAVIRDVIGYKDTARKLDVLTLINYLLSASMNELKSYRDCADVGDQYGLPKVNHSTLSKKAGHMDYNIMKKLFHLVVYKCNRMTRRVLKIPKRSSFSGLHHDNSGKVAPSLGPLSWKTCGNQTACQLSYSPLTEMPLQVVETTGLLHDGPIGEQLVDSRFIMVEDRAYFKIKRIDQFTVDQQMFVIQRISLSNFG